MSLERVGKAKVVASGTVVLGPDDNEFEIQLEDLIFIIAFVNNPDIPNRIYTERTAPKKVRISLNNPNPLGGFTKFKVGSLHDGELHFAMYWTSGGENYVASYTFSEKRAAQ